MSQKDEKEPIGKKEEKENKTEWEHNLSVITSFLHTFIKWLILATIMGVVCGAVGTSFYYMNTIVNGIREENQWLIFLLPVGGLAIVFLYQICQIEKDKGTNMVIASIRFEEELPLKMTPLIYVGTLITHLFGGSSGREGAALQMGGSLGAAIGSALKLDKRDIHMMTMCGMAAVFTALFGTPVTATIFSIEVVSVGILHYSAILPCALAVTVADFFTRQFDVHALSFHLQNVPELTIPVFFKVIILSALCAGVSMLFCWGMHFSGHFFEKKIPNAYLRVFVGAALIIGITLLVGSQRYNGIGMDIIKETIRSGNALPWDFLIKILLTAITLGTGFKGGEIVPSLFIGATFGCVVGNLMGMDFAFAAALGMICMFCGAVNCPIASLFLSVELFGTEGMLLFGLGCAVSYMLSGYFGLYSSQMIVYSKLHPVFINRFTK